MEKVEQKANEYIEMMRGTPNDKRIAYMAGWQDAMDEQAKNLQQPPVISAVCEICADYEKGDNSNIYCTHCGRKVKL